MICRSGSGEHLWFNGSLLTVVVPGVDTGNAFDLIEVFGRGGNMTPLHTDPTCETFRVLEGELLVHIAGEESRAAAGDTVVIPAGVPHAIKMTSPTARLLVLNVPGGHDAFFRAAGTPAAVAELPPAGPPDMPRMVAAARQCGIEIAGPPPFSR